MSAESIDATLSKTARTRSGTHFSAKGDPPEPDRLPKSLTIDVRHGLTISKAGLPAYLVNEIRQIATFANPEFFKKQNLRLSTARTPRMITCIDDDHDLFTLPRGCLQGLLEVLRKHDVEPEIEDHRFVGEEVSFRFQGTLSSMQEEAATVLLSHDTGILVAPPGTGKTVVGIYAIAARARSTLILVHRKPLLDQWLAQLSVFLGVDRKDIGQIGAGKNKPNERLDVAMIQTLVRNDSAADILNRYAHVIVDEAHRSPPVSYEHVLSKITAKYVLGLTATPVRRDGLHPIMTMQLGPIRLKIDAKNAKAKNPFRHILIIRETSFTADHLTPDAGVQQLFSALTDDDSRNEMIFDDVLHALEEGRSPILLTERRSHLEYFENRFHGFARNLIVLHGGLGKKQRDAALGSLSAVPDDEERLVISTGRFIGEGFDDPRLDTLFLAMPVSWKGTLVQYAGRIHRLYPGKSEVRIYDYVDRSVPMAARMFEKRLRGYRSLGYTTVDTSD